MRDDLDIRIAREGDRDVARLAALDSTRPIAGRALVASVGGRAIAAVAYDGTASVADPFARTADVLTVLGERSAQLRGVAVAGELRRFRRGERSRRRAPVAPRSRVRPARGWVPGARLRPAT